MIKPEKVQRKMQNARASTGAIVDATPQVQFATKEENVRGNIPTTVNFDDAVQVPEIQAAMDLPQAVPQVKGYQNEAPLVQSFCAQIDKYIVENPINTSDSPRRIIEKQRILLNTLKSIVMMESEKDFGYCLNYALTKFYEHRNGSFSPAMVSRMITQLGLSDKQMNNARYFLDFMTVFCDKRGRSSLMQRYNVGRACDFAGPYKERLINYVSYLAG